MAIINALELPGQLWGFVQSALVDYITDGNTYPRGIDVTKNMFGVGDNASPGGWNTKRPLFFDQALGFDCPMVDGVTMAKMVQRFIEHPDTYIAEFNRYLEAGCTFGQWWCQEMPLSAVSFYARFDLVSALYSVHDWGGGSRAIVGDSPCPFANGTGGVDERNSILQRLSVYCLPSWWEEDFGKKFYNQHMLYWWWIRRAFATGWGFEWGDEGFWHTFQQQLIAPDDLGLIVWIMAFMHQLMILRTARHCFCLPTQADDDFS